MAKAIRHCVEQNERIVVLASTNLAVDNALTAILQEGVAKENVLRMGIPSEDFRDAFPECCEARAFREKSEEIAREIGKLERTITSINELQQYVLQIAEHRTHLEFARNELSALQSQIEPVAERLKEGKTIQERLREELKQLKDRRQLLETEFDRLAFPQLVKEVKALEMEQTQTIMRQAELQKMDSLGWLERLFTKRKRALTDAIEREKSHLEAVERTLQTKRQERDELAPRVAVLEETIVQLHSQETAVDRKLSEQQRQIEDSTTKQQKLLETIAERQNLFQRSEDEIGNLDKKVSALDVRCTAAQREEVAATCQTKIVALKAELDLFSQNLSHKTVLGMTLDGFIGLTVHTGINAHRVFIDEAPYAPLAKILPVLSLKCPIAMLGDDRQLPPVCEAEFDPTIRAYWAKPAIFLEDAFNLGGNWMDLNELSVPSFERIRRCILTRSYRFGQRLASLLDRHVYDNIGLEGLANDTTIKCIHCEPENEQGRDNYQNDAEADIIVKRVGKLWEWVNRQPTDQPVPTIAILTPYKKQERLINEKLMAKFENSPILDHVEVLNTHKAQGREWDWVLYSASDTRRLQRNWPFLSDSSNPKGKSVLNTTISRTKKHLRIFLDVADWRTQPRPSILEELAREHPA